MYNNPAFLTFLMATTQAYWPHRPARRRRGRLAGRDRRRRAAARLGRDRRPRRTPTQVSLPGEMNLCLQRDDDPIGPDVRRRQRAGHAVPGLRRLPGRRPTRPRDRRSDRRGLARRRPRKSCSPMSATTPTSARHGLDGAGPRAPRSGRRCRRWTRRTVCPKCGRWGGRSPSGRYSRSISRASLRVSEGE